MARPESVAVGGYFPTPPRVVPLIRAELEFERGTVNVVDPCAGEGDAVLALTDHESSVTLYTCELEATRHAELAKKAARRGWNNGRHALRGDAFRADMGKGGWASLLYLNPPYDTDPNFNRLEHRFLVRFAPVLNEGGLLAYVVPHYALAASAELLALEFDELSCLRFPDPEFEVYKQVVLFARAAGRRVAPDREILRLVNGWSKSTARMPILGESDEIKPRAVNRISWSSPTWSMRKFDLVALKGKARPWRQSSRVGRLESVPNVLPSLPVQELMFRTFPVLTQPRPAHIAAGIASGLFNGRRVSSPIKGLPDLLVKGMFEREYITIEQRENEDGDLSEVQVQQPKLAVVVLDLSTGRFIELRPGGRTESKRINEMTLEDVLDAYGASLLRVMNEQCPAAFIPERDETKVPLAPLARDLFTAQRHATQAIVTALGGVVATRAQRRRKVVVTLGEIGCGKTSCALAAAKTVAPHGLVLVMCPPHLLTSWANEARAVVPEADVRIIEDIADIDTLRGASKLTFAVLSREKAKLGHGHESVNYECPGCGARISSTTDHSKRRERCTHQPLIVGNELAHETYKLALALAPCAPENEAVRAILYGRHMRRVLRRFSKRPNKPAWHFNRAWCLRVLGLLGKLELKESVLKTIGQVLLALGDDEHTAALAAYLGSSEDYMIKEVGEALTHFVPGELAAPVRATFKVSYWGRPCDFAGEFELAQSSNGISTSLGKLASVDGELSVDGLVPGSLKQALGILAKLTTLSKFKLGAECGTELFQASPTPRRYPIARYICKRHPDLFDLLIVDESHEYNSPDSAQGHAAQRLIGLGLPTIDLTGSVMNGYADSLFTMWQAISPAFREEFGRDDRQKYIDRYGYRKRIVSERTKPESVDVVFGSQSDRVVRSERNAGTAPGVLPLFIFRHLLPVSVTLHKADLKLELPKCVQHTHRIQADPDQLASYNELEDKLTAQIKADMFEEGLAGKLFGQLSELPSYLDRCTADVGNRKGGGPYVIAYPESIGGAVVAQGACFEKAGYRLPKERKMLKTIKAELAEGRNMMVFTWHTELLNRLARIIRHEIGEDVPILYSEKVPTAKRQDWIDREVVKKKRRVMVANPVTVQTGLNNLVWFNSEWWHENPACNPIIARQATGRVDRIGATKETRIHWPIYAGTLQEAAHDLLLKKIAISTATDGLDPESVLIAAGGSDDAALAGLSLGRQLWTILNERAAAAE